MVVINIDGANLRMALLGDNPIDEGNFCELGKIVKDPSRSIWPFVQYELAANTVCHCARARSSSDIIAAASWKEQIITPTTCTRLHLLLREQFSGEKTTMSRFGSWPKTAKQRMFYGFESEGTVTRSPITTRLAQSRCA